MHRLSGLTETWCTNTIDFDYNTETECIGIGSNKLDYSRKKNKNALYSLQALLNNKTIQPA